ncbi:hypothetical protein T261_3766 [Streptomyces lydicus]|nr:hypothetical protein T261_3766 [Streptomyces lydicus]
MPPGRTPGATAVTLDAAECDGTSRPRVKRKNPATPLER